MRNAPPSMRIMLVVSVTLSSLRRTRESTERFSAPAVVVADGNTMRFEDQACGADEGPGARQTRRNDARVAHVLEDRHLAQRPGHTLGEVGDGVGEAAADRDG